MFKTDIFNTHTFNSEMVDIEITTEEVGGTHEHDDKEAIRDCVFYYSIFIYLFIEKSFIQNSKKKFFHLTQGSACACQRQIHMQKSLSSLSYGSVEWSAFL